MAIIECSVCSRGIKKVFHEEDKCPKKTENLLAGQTYSEEFDRVFQDQQIQPLPVEDTLNEDQCEETNEINEQGDASNTETDPDSPRI